MLSKHDDLEKIDELIVEKNSIWMQTPLHDFGPKCIMNEHNLCCDPKCKCLCHKKREN